MLSNNTNNSYPFFSSSWDKYSKSIIASTEPMYWLFSIIGEIALIFNLSPNSIETIGFSCSLTFTNPCLKEAKGTPLISISQLLI